MAAHLDYTLQCPHCGLPFTSKVDYAGARAQIRSHIEFKHPEFVQD